MHKFIMSGVIALGLALSAAPAMAENPAFQLINNSSHNVTEFYTGPSSDPSWGPNLLVDFGPLAAGASATVTIGDGSEECNYDFKFTTEDGGDLEVKEINICELNSYTLND